VPRRVTPSQLRNMIRQAEQKQKQAINKYNSAVRDWNRKTKNAIRDWNNAVDQYNRDVRAHNSRVRSNRQRLRSELQKLTNQGSHSRYGPYKTSVQTLQQAFVRVEEKVESGAWGVPGDMLLDLTERETANSVEVLNALLADPAEAVDDSPDLRSTSLTHELADISPDLDQRWRGALFALNPANPDAARHFCSSSREILGQVLAIEAPDEEVLEVLPNSPMTDRGTPTRRAKIQFFLIRKELPDADLEAFVEHDLENVVTLFDLLNEGTHGSAGTFNLNRLAVIKRRVEDAIQFLYQVIR
jgi:gas vesicle protein